MTIRYSPAAETDLREVWNSNAGRYDADHADRYLAFLRAGISELIEDPHRGRPVPAHESYRYIVRKRRSRGAGHVVVYEVADDQINVLRVFHTAQDWHGKMERGER